VHRQPGAQLPGGAAVVGDAGLGRDPGAGEDDDVAGVDQGAEPLDLVLTAWRVRRDGSILGATTVMAMGVTADIDFRRLPIDQGDAAMLAQAMRDEISAMYDGMDLDAAHMPKAGAAELGPPSGAFLVGYRAGVPVCCGGVKRLDERHCEIKRMYVAPEARGAGVGRVLLHALEDTARELGYVVARLDTGPRQPGAQHMYESEGYTVIANFNGNPVASFFGEKPL
jgi:GNAT superfamily N-acetyltransferase